MEVAVMGGSYEYLMLLESSQEQAVAALSDYEGWLVEQGDVVVLFLSSDRSLDPPLPQAVSEATGSRTLRFWVFDDEVFGCEAWQGQRFVAEFTAQDPGEYLGLDAEQIEEMDELAAEAGFAGAEATGPAAFVAAVGSTTLYQ